MSNSPRRGRYIIAQCKALSDSLEIKKRCGQDPHTLPEGEKSIACNNCPDVFELENGDFAIIGVRITKELTSKLPDSANCGPDEEIVLVPRYVLANARQDIPNYENYK